MFLKTMRYLQVLQSLPNSHLKLSLLGRNFCKNQTPERCRTEIGLLQVSRNKSQLCLITRSMSIKKHLDYTNVPKIDEADIEIQFVRGSGPGGQATNKTNNAVLMKHKPTGLVVKCHQSRSVWENKKTAFELLTMKLDTLMNGKNSIEEQIKAIQAKKSTAQARKKRKLDELKAAFKEREGLD
ncbi:mitochondrial translation release factor in rescue [Diprion similis]|uniref:mitochondrial translation release factor in rescue n=1 Tax=Diprion similis TaxID=362088 RepID=UPI001EF900C6|nr:mitochondrial translation release factor in rescue [Diprion similis]